MKGFFKPNYLPHVTLLCGGAGLLLRSWLMYFGFDDGGLMIPGHPAGILLWILTGLYLVYLCISAWDLIEAPKFRFNYPASLVSAIGAALGAVGIGINSFMEFVSAPDNFQLLSGLLGICAAGVVGYTALCRRKGQRPNAVCHCFVCIYLMIHLVSVYRFWVSDPQFQDYCFQVLAIASLLPGVFNRASFDCDLGNRRLLVIFHLAAVYFGLVAIADCSNWYFFLCTALWMLTDLCSLVPMHHGNELEEL